MVFVTSIILGLCMGSSAFFSMQFGRRDQDRLQQGIYMAFLMIGIVTVTLNVFVYAGIYGILAFLRVPIEVAPFMKTYLLWIFSGIAATFLYNFVANFMRALKLADTTLFSWHLGSAEYFSGFIFYKSAAVGGRRRRNRNSHLTVCRRCRHSDILREKISSSTYQKGKQAMAFKHSKGTARSVVLDMPTAVGHEFWHLNGTGACQQLWFCGDGCICRGCQD